MDDKQSWNAVKKELWKKKDSELLQHLNELEADKRRLEYRMMTGTGSSMLVRNYPSDKVHRVFGNLKSIRKRIACIKTMLHLKMRRGS